MSVRNLIQMLEEQGFKFSIWEKRRLRIHPSSTGYSAITPQIMAELVEKRAEIVQYLRARAAVQLASPQRREEPPVIQVKGKPLTEQQLKLIDALTYAHTVAQAGRIAGYGTRQATHKAYNALLRRLPGILPRALSSWCIRQNEQEL
jgi:hypothetical protein